MELIHQYNIRPAAIADVPAMLDIYAPFVRDTAITFEYDVPQIAEFEDRLRYVTLHYPWLVAVYEGKLAGYAYAVRFRERAAYQWCCECSVYIHPDFRRKGLATRLYGHLFQELKQRGFINVYAVITLPNPESVALHEYLGFESAGILRNSGYKLDAWHDVFIMERFLDRHPEHPTLPNLHRNIG